MVASTEGGRRPRGAKCVYWFRKGLEALKNGQRSLLRGLIAWNGLTLFSCLESTKVGPGAAHSFTIDEWQGPDS